MARRSATRSRPARGLTRTDTTALRRELERRAAALMARRDQLVSEMDALEAEVESLGGAAPTPPAPRQVRRRARNKTTLVEALRAALKSKTMSAGEAVKAVTAAGYKTTSRTLVTQVRIALAKRKHFKRVERGRYTAK